MSATKLTETPENTDLATYTKQTYTTSGHFMGLTDCLSTQQPEPGGCVTYHYCPGMGEYWVPLNLSVSQIMIPTDQMSREITTTYKERLL